jgi:ABC-2 type transport system permease protein
MRRDSWFGDRRTATVIAITTAKRAARSGALWGAGFGAYVAVQASTYGTSYPTAAARASFAQSLSSNAGLAALVGPARRLDTVAGYMSWRLGVLSIIGAIWGLLIATRLLRGEEEAGRWELLVSAQTTRRGAAVQAMAGLALGLATLWAVTAVFTVAEGSRSSIDFSTTASLFYATAAIASAAMFIAIGVLVGQISATRRQANGIAAAVFGASFLIRMIADSGGGLEWLRWASPLGWVEELRPLIGTRPFALVPIVVLVAVAAAGAIVIAGQRDLGASLLAGNDTAEPDTRLLAGTGGLAVRLGRSVALGWIAGLAVLGLVMGLVAQSASQAMSGSTTIEQAMARLGGHHSGAESYLGLAFLIAAALVAFAAAGQIAAIRSDEADGYLDNLLVRPVARRTWLAGRLAFGAALVALASIAAGVGAWIGAATQHSHVGFSAMFQAGLNIATPALFMLGVGGLIYGLYPRLVSPILYGLVAWAFVIEIIRSSVKANHWLLDTAVLSHIPPVPAADLNWTAIAWLAGLGLLAATLGLLAFNRRDLASA